MAVKIKPDAMSWPSWIGAMVFFGIAAGTFYWLLDRIAAGGRGLP